MKGKMTVIGQVSMRKLMIGSIYCVFVEFINSVPPIGPISLINLALFTDSSQSSSFVSQVCKMRTSTVYTLGTHNTMSTPHN